MYFYYGLLLEQVELELMKKKEKKEKKKKKKSTKAVENGNGKTEINDTDNDEFKQQLHGYHQFHKENRPNVGELEKWLTRNKNFLKYGYRALIMPFDYFKMKIKQFMS